MQNIYYSCETLNYSCSLLPRRSTKSRACDKNFPCPCLKTEASTHNPCLIVREYRCTGGSQIRMGDWSRFTWETQFLRRKRSVHPPCSCAQGSNSTSNGNTKFRIAFRSQIIHNLNQLDRIWTTQFD